MLQSYKEPKNFVIFLIIVIVLFAGIIIKFSVSIHGDPVLVLSKPEYAKTDEESLYYTYEDFDKLEYFSDINTDGDDEKVKYILKTTVLSQLGVDSYIIIPELVSPYSVYIGDKAVYPGRAVFDFAKFPYLVYKVPPDSTSMDIYILSENAYLDEEMDMYPYYYGDLTDIVLDLLEESFYNAVLGLLFIISALIMLFMNYISRLKNNSIIIFSSIITFILGIIIICNVPIFVMTFYAVFSGINYFMYIIFEITLVSTIIYLVSLIKNHKGKTLKIVSVVHMLVTIILCLFTIYVLTSNIRPLINVDLFIIYIVIVNIIIGTFYYYTLRRNNRLMDNIIFIILNILILFVGLSYGKYFSINMIYIIPIFAALIVFIVFRTVNVMEQRSLDIDLLYDNIKNEQDKINYLHSSDIDNFAKGKINTLSKNIAMDLKNIFDNIDELFIAQINKLGKFEVLYQNNEDNLLDSYERIFIENYEDIGVNSFTKKYSGTCLYATFKASTYEVLFIYLRRNRMFDEKDKMAVKIILPSISNALNNTEVFSDYMDLQEELFYELGRVLNIKSGNKNNMSALMKYAYVLALKNGFTQEEAFEFKLATLIYDIGKFGIPDSLTDSSKIDNSQIDYYMEHVIVGEDMLKNSNNTIIKIAAICSLEHHEDYNGQGYLGKKENNISIYGRMLRVVVEFDKYVKGSIRFDDFNINNCVSHLISESGKKLDPKQIEIFLSEINEIEKIIDFEYDNYFEGLVN